MRKKILIVGGGFAGVKAALDLSKIADFQVTVLSADDVFNYYPSLYHTATGGSRIVSSIPLGELFGGKPIQVIKDKAVSIDRKNRTIKIASGDQIEYDTVIFAIGVITNFFGIHGLEKFSQTIKSVDRVIALKAHLQQQLTSEHKPDLNYVLIGAGPTGIEFAGALPQYLRSLMKKHGVPERKIHVDLIEARDRILPQVPEAVSRAITKRLKSLGVKIITGQAVESETADKLTLGNSQIKSRTVIWTAGVMNNPFFEKNGFALNKSGRVIVDGYMAAEPDIYVIGDNADTPYSGMAQTALYDAIYVSYNLVRKMQGKKLKPYKPKKPVYVYPVGERWAAVVWGRFRFYGFTGWLLRRAADWIGYHDVEPWWKATARTLADSIRED